MTHTPGILFCFHALPPQMLCQLRVPPLLSLPGQAGGKAHFFLYCFKHTPESFIDDFRLFS
jgi:hypothetical protein